MMKISINGQEYPCRVTMGAFIDFKNETGREASEVSSASVSDMIVFIWCCIKSACRHDKVEFSYNLEEFADATDAETLNAFYAETADGKKKEQTGPVKK